MPNSDAQWHSRGYLPHCDLPNLSQFVTFRLADSLPESVRVKLDEEQNETLRLVAREGALDAGHGACWLDRVDIAGIVESALLHFDGERYELLAWVIMPNHVHLLLRMAVGHALRETIRSWKTFTAAMANRKLGRKGRFWAPEYFDRYIRDEEHFGRVVRYIHGNPVKAGLVPGPEAWRFGSARLRRGLSYHESSLEPVPEVPASQTGGAEAPRSGASAPRSGASAPRSGASAPRSGASAPRSLRRATQPG